MQHNSVLSSSPPRTSPPPPRGRPNRPNGRPSDAMEDIDMDHIAGSIDNGPSQSHLHSMPPTTPRQYGQNTRPQVTMPTTDVQDTDMYGSEAGGNGQATIWGTSINIDEVAREFRRFFRDFDKNGTNIYPPMIEDAIESENWNLNLDCSNLFSWSEDLYTQLIRFPQEVLPCIDNVVNTMAETLYSDLLGEASSSEEIWVRPFNLRQVKSMRSMDPSDIDSLVSISGMVVRSTGIIPDIQEAFFRCQLCHYEIEVAIDLGRIQEPLKCNNEQCQGTNCMELIHNRSKFQDKQLVKVQETPENIPDGETPQTIDVYCYDLMVDLCRPGDRVEITGVYRASAIRPNPRRRTIEAVYRSYVDSVHIKKNRNNQINVEDAHVDRANEDYTGFADDDDYTSLRQEKIDELKDLANDPNIYDKLVNSLAPSIWQMEDVKKGILCQLFGATRKDFGSISDNKFRSQLNVLLCGDPGTSKSQLLQYVHKVAPRGIYTSGKGSSAVGLTAYITKDPDSGDLVLESGALVLSDRGICCIDEFDKMSDSARSILHEVMEQQTVSIAKAGIICTLNARTSILAAANPRESRYNPTKSVVENIDLPPTLMSRFDLIYLVLDRPNESLDRKLAQHIISLYYSEEEIELMRDERSDDLMSQELLMQYISYSRREIQPRLTDEACERLCECYMELRSMGRESGRNVITATPRQLESLIRISEALARMRHSTDVLDSDVDEALRLHKVATLAAATDPRTGAIDLDSIAVGRTAEQGRMLQDQAALMLDVLNNYERSSIRASNLKTKYNERVQQNAQEQQQVGQVRQRGVSGSGAQLKRIEMNELKQIVERLEQAERLRCGDWLRDDPVITIVSKEPL